MGRAVSLLSVAIAIDQLANAMLAGWPDETLSSRAYRMDGRKRRWTVARASIDRLFFWQPDHCKQSYDSERMRRQLPPEFRQ